MSRRIRAFLTLVFIAAASGCGTEAELVRLSGTWSGVAQLPTGFSTTMNLSQTGASVTGTMTLSGSFVGRNISGAVNESNRTFAWSVLSSCEVWTGLLTVDGSGDTMSGTVFADFSGCPSGSDVSGTMSVTRQ